MRLYVLQFLRFKWLNAWQYILAILLFSAFFVPHTHPLGLPHQHHDTCLACQLTDAPKLKAVEYIISPGFEAVYQLPNLTKSRLITIHIQRFYGLSPPNLPY